MSDYDFRRENMRRVCRWFTGVHNERCFQGVVYEKVSGGGSGWMRRLPCGLTTATEPAMCSQKRHWTEKEIEEDIATRIERSNNATPLETATPKGMR